MRYQIFFVIFIPLFFSSGCSIQQPEPTVTFAKGLRIYSTTAYQQSTMMKDHGSAERFCLARGTDVAETERTGVGASFGFADNNEDLSESSSIGAAGLGGRNPAVLITRELMYRTCEMIMNLNLSKEDALELYVKTLEASVTLSKTQTGTGTSETAPSTEQPAETSTSTTTSSTDSDDTVTSGVD